MLVSPLVMPIGVPTIPGTAQGVKARRLGRQAGVYPHVMPCGMLAPMCGFCAMVSGMPHWTENSPDAGSGGQVDSRERRLERLFRVKLVNAVIAGHGCTLEDWAMGQYIVRSQRGRSELVPALPQVWLKVEDISGRTVDPLDPALLERLRALSS